MEAIANFNNYLGQATALFLVIVGIYLTYKAHFFQFTKLGLIFRSTIGQLFRKEKGKEEKGLSSFQAFATSLAGTIGVGNIVGVSSAIAIGGAGSIFWMLAASFFGMIIKYAEIYISIKHGQGPSVPNNKNYSFAPMNYLKKATKSKLFPIVFAVLGVFTSLLMGNMAQINAVCLSVCPSFNLSPQIVGIITVAIIGFLIFGKQKNLFHAIEFLIPFVGCCYILGGILVITLNYQNIIPSLYLIIKTAFVSTAAFGGIVGAGIAKAFSQGIMKGVFSNEAGTGSAGLAHGSCKEKAPEVQGLWGAVEVFLDTVVISGITALIILTSGAWRYGGMNGVFRSFSLTFGKGGEIFTAGCILFFAVTSVLSWSYYGESCVAFLTKEHPRWIFLFRILFVATVFVSTYISVETIWIFS